MVVTEFDLTCIGAIPGKADSILVVDPNAVLPFAVCLELLEVIAWRRSEILVTGCGVDDAHLHAGALGDVRMESSDVLALVDLPGVRVSKAGDRHLGIIAYPEPRTKCIW